MAGIALCGFTLASLAYLWLHATQGKYGWAAVSLLLALLATVGAIAVFADLS